MLLCPQMPFIDPTAKQLSFQKYYHYQRFCKDRLITLLRDKKLFFSGPYTFNDPWDCKPWFDYRPMLEDPVKSREGYDTGIRTDDDELKKEVEKYSCGLGEQIRKMRVYCLSVVPESTLMWSHYSANHRGICLEFD